MAYENKVLIIHNLKDFDSGRTARHGTYNLQGKLEELDEVYRKAEVFDRLYAEFDKGDKDLSKADFDAVYKLYESEVRG